MLLLLIIASLHVIVTFSWLHHSNNPFVLLVSDKVELNDDGKIDLESKAHNQYNLHKRKFKVNLETYSHIRKCNENRYQPYTYIRRNNFCRVFLPFYWGLKDSTHLFLKVPTSYKIIVFIWCCCLNFGDEMTCKFMRRYTISSFDY